MNPLYHLLLAFLLATTCFAQTKVFHGLLHSHTSFSDGSGIPEEAFAKAKSAGVDFFAITEHNHLEAEDGAKDRIDGILIAKDPRLYESTASVPLTQNGVTKNVKSVRQSALDATDATFVAIYGQEFSSISSGNHVNVLGVDKVITVPNGSFNRLYEHLDQLTERVVLQMNHPGVQRDLFYGGSDQKEKRKAFNDYGFDDYDGDFDALVKASSKYLRLIEIFSGPDATKNVSHPSYHYSDDHGDDYYYYLVQGFRISPSVGHDDHYKHWGSKSPARMGIWADSLTRDNIFLALQNNWTFASEDSDLSLRFTVNGKMMGGIFEASIDTPLVFRVEVTDQGHPDKTFEATLYSGIVQPQTRDTLRRVVESDGERDQRDADSNGVATFEGNLVTGNREFYYVVVRQQDGDRAWSAPVWVQPLSGAPSNAEIFAWTKNPNSKVYHKRGCVAVKSIAPANLVEGPTPPEGRTLHNCKIQTPDEH